jgi:hypothetical protein
VQYNKNTNSFTLVKNATITEDKDFKNHASLKIPNKVIAAVAAAASIPPKLT